MSINTRHTITVESVKKIELRNCAQFRRNRSNRDRDMAIFQLFKMAAVCHLGFVMRVSRPPM